MPRLPYAAKALTDQVRTKLNRKPDSKAGLETSRRVGDPDGLGVYRSIEFDKIASKLLADVDLTTDARVESVEVEKGVATVTFVAGRIADTRDPFDLDAAADVQDADDD